MTENQNPEQQARDRIDAQLRAAGWAVQKKIDFSAGIGQAVREWTTDAGPADYVLFVDKKAVGVIEAKRESEGQRHGEQRPLIDLPLLPDKRFGRRGEADLPARRELRVERDRKSVV